MERYAFFDPVEIAPGVFDREYNAQEFTDYFASIVQTGLIYGEGNELEVYVNGTDMVSRVKPGAMFIEGRYYENTSELELTHDTESFGLNRIDRIVIQLDCNPEARYVRAYIKKGVPSTDPQPPELTRNGMIYEVSLAAVTIIGGKSYIESTELEDERGKELFLDTDNMYEICPYAKTKLDSNTMKNNIFTPDTPSYLYPRGVTIFRAEDDPNWQAALGTGHLIIQTNRVNLENAVQIIIRTGPVMKVFVRQTYVGEWQDFAEVVTDAPTEWINLTLQSGVRSVVTPQFTKKGSQVFLRGSVENIVSSNTVIATLPSGYRPSVAHSFANPSSYSSGTNKFARWVINPNGQIVMERTSDDTYQSNYWFPISTSFIVD